MTTVARGGRRVGFVFVAGVVGSISIRDSYPHHSRTWVLRKRVFLCEEEFGVVVEVVSVLLRRWLGHVCGGMDYGACVSDSRG